MRNAMGPFFRKDISHVRNVFVEKWLSLVKFVLVGWCPAVRYDSQGLNKIHARAAAFAVAGPHHSAFDTDTSHDRVPSARTTNIVWFALLMVDVTRRLRSKPGR